MSLLIHQVTNTKQVMGTLLEIFERFNTKELDHFKKVQQRIVWTRGLRRIPRFKMLAADRHELVELMMEMYGEETVEMTTMVLKDMNRPDLVEMLSDSSSASKGTSCGKWMLQRCEMPSIIFIIVFLIDIKVRRDVRGPQRMIQSDFSCV